MTKIFHVPQKKLGITEGKSTFSIETIKTKCVDMENVHIFVNESSHVEVYTNTNFEEFQSLFNITQKLILEHSEKILNMQRQKYLSTPIPYCVWSK